MNEQLELDIRRILISKYGIEHPVKVMNSTTVGTHRTCSVKVGEGWVFDHIVYESLNGSGVFNYHPETVADLMIDKIHRYKKYGKVN